VGDGGWDDDGGDAGHNEEDEEVEEEVEEEEEEEDVEEEDDEEVLDGEGGQYPQQTGGDNCHRGGEKLRRAKNLHSSAFSSSLFADFPI
jgi:hypothetical protein